MTQLTLDCDDAPDRVAQLIRMAEASCYTMAALRGVAPVELSASVNGQPFETGA